MKYDMDKNWIKRLLKTTDVMNTVNGGMAQPQLNFARKSDHYLLTAHIPGVDVDGIGVEMVEDNLILHQKIDFEDSDGRTMKLPYVIATFPVQGYVDYKGIEAKYESGVLQVILPFNELSSGYHKTINIQRT